MWFLLWILLYQCKQLHSIANHPQTLSSMQPKGRGEENTRVGVRGRVWGETMASCRLVQLLLNSVLNPLEISTTYFDNWAGISAGRSIFFVVITGRSIMFLKIRNFWELHLPAHLYTVDSLEQYFDMVSTSNVYEIMRKKTMRFVFVVKPLAQ